ncbi:cupin domain-containing protein [Pseudohalioglobus lutimaris]|uniref:Cupin domain-containing protein n=1 Tax=Pseudohalioglobus lutimaris TaxID=1737061 RepID=A0A2N5X844_9GAMM|nr:cupin domain-containing protein [Pseudohalioglobus lutimaris]PLW70649.1 cupin domain-containing protein [Pseudohalioglobus lutimaris]
MISRYSPEAEFHTSEQCHILELHNSPLDEGCSIARARVEPGVTTQLHALHGTAERYVILTGEGQVSLGGRETLTVGELDVVTIAAGESQCITNIGEQDLVFLCVCTPRFRQENYVNLEP